VADDDDEWTAEMTTRQTSVKLMSVEQSTKPHLLELVRGPGAPNEWILNLDEMTIGRSSQVEISVNSEELSRQHAQIKKKGNAFALMDLDSRNGVYLNGVKIYSAVLRHGDTIQMGNVLLIYHEGN
jgi:pSer/pThr/pTyr-binding forkhead associated (FHA) protein